MRYVAIQRSGTITIGSYLSDVVPTIAERPHCAMFMPEPPGQSIRVYEPLPEHVQDNGHWFRQVAVKQ